MILWLIFGNFPTTLNMTISQEHGERQEFSVAFCRLSRVPHLDISEGTHFQHFPSRSMEHWVRSNSPVNLHVAVVRDLDWSNA